MDLDNGMAINGNVCHCEVPDEGLRGKSGQNGRQNGHSGQNGRLCRRCGLEIHGPKGKVESWWRDWINTPFEHQGTPGGPGVAKKGITVMGGGPSTVVENNMRRSQSEESMSTTNNPYEAMRKQRLSASTNVQNSRYDL